MDMRAVVYAERIVSKFLKIGTMRSPIRLDALCSNGHAGPPSSSTEALKGPRAKFSDVYIRDRHLYASLMGGLVVLAFFVIFVFSFESKWDFAEEQRQLHRFPHRSLAFTGATFEAVEQSDDTRTNWDVPRKRKVSALHGMGVTFRAGSRSMNELIIAHLAEQTSPDELRLFLRTLHRSGATARADVVLLFPWPLPDSISRVIDEEEHSFQQLVLERQNSAPPHWKKNGNVTAKEVEQIEAIAHASRSILQEAPPEIRSYAPPNATISPFNARAFWKSKEDRRGRAEALLATETSTDAGNSSNGGSDGVLVADWADYGSIIGFEMQDLDQGDVLDGFIEKPPVQLRRWTCYQMLLGMTKSKYRIVLLAEVRGTVILRDIVAPARRKSFDSSINLYNEDLTWNDVHKNRKKVTSGAIRPPQNPIVPNEISPPLRKHGTEHSESNDYQSEHTDDPHAIGHRRLEMHFIEEVYGKDVWKKLDREDKERATLGTALILGSNKPIRSICNAILTEIAALALKRKSREAFHDRALLNYLVHKSTVLSRRVTGKLRMLGNAETTVHSLPGSRQPSDVFFRADGHGFAAILGLMDDALPTKRATAITRAIRDEICLQGDAWAYPDCSH